MNPLRRLAIKLGLQPITPDDLLALLAQTQDDNLPPRTRFRALSDYVVLTQSDTQVNELVHQIRKFLRGGNNGR